MLAGETFLSLYPSVYFSLSPSCTLVVLPQINPHLKLVPPLAFFPRACVLLRMARCTWRMMRVTLTSDEELFGSRLDGLFGGVHSATLRAGQVGERAVPVHAMPRAVARCEVSIDFTALARVIKKVALFGLTWL